MAEVRWNWDYCILCPKQDKLTKEHIIPESLGGKLWARFVCKKCNDIMGYRVEADAKRDPSIRLAVHSLSNQIPDLAKSLSENQEFVGKSKQGWIRGRIKQDTFRVITSRQPDGSLIQPTEDARKDLEKELRKTSSENELSSILKCFDEAPENERIKIANQEFIKWSVDSLNPVLDGPLIGDDLPLLMAFEYLACCLGVSIYDYKLDPIRDSIRNKQASTDCYKVERLLGPENAPFHGLFIERNAPYVKIQIRLFGSIAFRVHFLQLVIGGNRFVYTLNLKEQTEHLQVLP